jgi:hypothetical protein
MQGIAVDGDVSGLHLVLPPADDAIQNGHFEYGLADWEVNLSVTPTVLAGAGHTGGYALEMSVPSGVHTTVWQVTHTYPITVTSVNPTLSWFYVVSGTTSAEDWLWVQVQGETGSITDTVTATLPLTADGWTHHWLGLESLAGQAVTVAFGLQNPEGLPGNTVLLDEVTLGGGKDELRRRYLPAVSQNGW